MRAVGIAVAMLASCVALSACSSPVGDWAAGWIGQGGGVAHALERAPRAEVRAHHHLDPVWPLDVEPAPPPPPAPTIAPEEEEVAEDDRCPEGMAEIDGEYCIDRYEASVVEVLSRGRERPFSPFSSVAHRRVRALSVPGVFPQGYISEVEAKRACRASGKRLCRVREWQKACRGPRDAVYGYGPRREPGRCNDTGRNPVIVLFGKRRWTWRTMNSSRLNQLPRTLARTGEHEACTNGYGVFDMVGNLHEWVADSRGTFYGGYYQDTWQHGDGCSYVTRAHEARYHDYSTGFRCCADVLPEAGEGSDRRRR